MSIEGNKSVILVVGRELPKEVDLEEARTEWQREQYGVEVVDVTGKKFHSALEQVARRVRTAVKNSSETLVLGVQEGGPYAAAMHTVLSRDPRIEPVTSLTVITVFSNFDATTAMNYTEAESLRFLEKSAAVGTLGINHRNTLSFQDRRNPKIQALPSASIVPVYIRTSLEDEIAKAVTNRRGGITGRLREHRMRGAQRM